MIKKIFIFACCLLPWFISNLIPLNYDFFEKINLPSFTPPKLFYPIAWTLIYIFIAITIYNVVLSYKLKDIPKNYIITLFINYICNQSFTIFFFGLQNTFLGMISCLLTFLSTLFLYEETSIINSKISKLLYSYIILSLFATILSIGIYLLNI